MLILALETSTPTGSVALLDDARLLAGQTLELGKKHAQSLIPAIDETLRAAGRTSDQLNLIAVSIGPGSYTGLRVGVVAAKSFAYALHCPLVAVDTLHAIAVNAPDDVAQVEVVADAQRGDLFVGRYRKGAPASWTPLQPVEVLATDTWIASLPAGQVVMGPGLDKIRSRLSPDTQVLDQSLWTPHALQVGRLGLQAATERSFAEVGTLEPTYLRRSSAEVQWEKLHPPS
jgi:tRNA threonylcarbamoyladenosine biosynthesis protein TsaB